VFRLDVGLSSATFAVGAKRLTARQNWLHV
jgi:hypothetical protein